MKKSALLSVLGLHAVMASQLEFGITKPEDDAKTEHKKRQAQQIELNKEYLIAEYKLIQSKQSNLTRLEREKLVKLCERNFKKDELM